MVSQPAPFPLPNSGAPPRPSCGSRRCARRMSGATSSTFSAPTRPASGSCPWSSSAGWWRSSSRATRAGCLLSRRGAPRVAGGAGIRLRTAADAELEEEFLFDSAVTRATAYPHSQLSEIRRARRAESAVAVSGAIPTASAGFATGAAAHAGRAGAALPRGHDRGARSARCRRPQTSRHARHRGRKLRAMPVPVLRPAHARAGGAAQASRRTAWICACKAISCTRWWPNGSVLLSRNRSCRCSSAYSPRSAARRACPPGYRTETLRVRMRADLERFAADTGHPAGGRTHGSKSLSSSPLIDVAVARPHRPHGLHARRHSRCHRLQVQQEGVGATPRTTAGLQGPLYLLAVEKVFGLKPGKMLYCGLRGAVQLRGADVTARDRLDGRRRNHPAHRGRDCARATPRRAPPTWRRAAIARSRMSAAIEAAAAGPP